MSGRTTGEIVLLIFATTIAAAVIITVIGLSVIALVNPGTDVTVAVQAVAQVLGVLIGVVVGYLIAGRRLARQSTGTE